MRRDVFGVLPAYDRGCSTEVVAAEVAAGGLVEVHFADAFFIALGFDLFAEEFAHFRAAMDGRDDELGIERSEVSSWMDASPVRRIHQMRIIRESFTR